MTDVFSKTKRSWIMGQVRAKNTTPENVVRSIVTSLGLRYRPNVSTLTGSPDLVFQSKRKVIFVHGCFWHGHKCLRGSRLPKSNVAYWKKKIDRNKKRDQYVKRHLRQNGWQVIIVWECQTQKPNIKHLVKRFMKNFALNQNDHIKS